MSYEAGGTILVVPAAAAALAAGAVVLIGGAALGAGYLAIKGACRGAQACKDSWDRHLQAIEEERKKRLAQLKAEDEKRINRVKKSFVNLANASDAFLKERENQLRKALEKEEQERLEDEQRNMERLANLKKMELLDRELAETQNQVFPAQMFDDEAKKDEYIQNLRAARQEFAKREKALAEELESSRVKKKESEKIAVENEKETTAVERGFEEIREPLKKLTSLRVATISFFSLQSNDRDVLVPPCCPDRS